MALRTSLVVLLALVASAAAEPLPDAAFRAVKDRDVVMVKKDGTTVQGRLLSYEKEEAVVALSDGTIAALKRADVTSLKLAPAPQPVPVAPLPPPPPQPQPAPAQPAPQPVQPQPVPAQLASPVAVALPQIPQMPGTLVGVPLRGYMRVWHSGEEEPCPRSVRHEAVMDEAVPVQIGPQQTCFAVIVRTLERYDEPLAVLKPHCHFSRRETEASVYNETVFSETFTVKGDAPIYRIPGSTDGRWAGLNIGGTPDREFRIITRTGSLCCAGVPHDRLELELVNRRITQGEKYEASFKWPMR
ncbi:MAG: hypothetical protein QM765_39650 [Myxococcales bacterium]